MKVLFILKKNEIYSFVSYTRRSSGLWNSVSFVAEALQEDEIHTKIIEVNDNNDIDRHVAVIRPDIVIIEALWVVPEKFKVLKHLHPKVKWFVHLHSHMSFLAVEGIAVEWIRAYAKLGIGMIANSLPSYNALRPVIGDRHLSYLPNVYRMRQMYPVKKEQRTPGVIWVGCFGAIRPLKNQLIQAMAAIKFSQEMSQGLVFVMNGSRVETGGEPIQKSIRALFEQNPGMELIEMPWMEPSAFIAFMNTWIDIGMQVSLTETFNIVTADYLTAGIPICVSKEIHWAAMCSKAQDDSVGDMVAVMHRAWNYRALVRYNRYLLKKAGDDAASLWQDWVWDLE